MYDKKTNKKPHFFKTIYVYDIHTCDMLYKFTCAHCINKKICRYSLEISQNCIIEHDIDNNHNIRSVCKASTWFGNQYFVLKNTKCIKAIKKISSQYIK